MSYDEAVQQAREQLAEQAEPWDERLIAALQPRLDESDAAWVVDVVRGLGGTPTQEEQE